MSSRQIPTSLSEFLDRFDARAQHGVCPGPRYRISFSVLGEGPPIHLVPGVCCPRRLLAPLAVELADDFRVVVHDLAGVEPGDGARMTRYRAEDYPQDLLCLASHLGHDRFGVVGISFGATIALRAMAGSNGIVRAMLVGGFVRRPLTRRERLSFGILRYWPGRLSNVPFMDMIARYNHQRELDEREPGLIDFLAAEHGRVSVRTAAAQILAVDQTDLADLIPVVGQPIMVVHGANDRLVPPEHAAELANRLRDVRIVLIPRCGHQPHLSHPEVLAEACRFFFESEV